jgi:Anti-sigma-K factor rskA, C-terminal
VAKQSTAKVLRFERQSDASESSRSATFPLRPLELTRPRKPTWPTLAALAIVTGLAAVGLGAWAVVTELRSTPSTETPAPSVEWSLGVLADSSARRYPFENSLGRIALVADDADRAVLTLDGLGPAPEGSIYEIWVIPPGSATPSAAGTFDGADRVIPLTRAVRSGARVGVTLEPAPGSDRPSRTLRLTVLRD